MITNIIQGKPSAHMLNGAKENGKKNTFTGFSQLLALMAGCIPNESTDASTSGKSMKGFLPKNMQNSSQKFKGADTPKEALKIFEIISNSPDISNDYIASSHAAAEYIHIKGGESNKSQIPRQTLTQLMRFIMTSDNKIPANKTVEDTLLIDHLLNPIHTSQNNEIKSLLSKYASELNIESVQLQLPDHASIKQVNVRGIRKGYTFQNKDIIPNKALHQVSSDTEKIKLMPEDLGQRLLKINQIKINQKGNFNDSSVPEIKSALLDHALNIEKYSIAKFSESLPQLETLPDMHVQEIYKTYKVNIEELPLSSIMQAKIKESISSTQLQEQTSQISKSAQSTSSNDTLQTPEKAALLSGRKETTSQLSGLLTKSNKEITQEFKNRAQSTHSLKTPSLSDMEVKITADTDKATFIPDIKEQMITSTAHLAEANTIETKGSEIKTDLSDLQVKSTENRAQNTNSPKTCDVTEMAVEFPTHSDKPTFISAIKEQVINADTAVKIFTDSDEPTFIPDIKEQMINADTAVEIPSHADEPIFIPAKEAKIYSDMASTIQELPIDSLTNLSDTRFIKTKGDLIENVAQSEIKADSSNLGTKSTENTAQFTHSPKMNTILEIAHKNSIQIDKPPFIPDGRENLINHTMASEIQEQPITAPDNLSEAGMIKTEGELIENVTQSGRNIDSFSSDLQAQFTKHAAQTVNSTKTYNISDNAAEIPLQTDKSVFISETKEQPTKFSSLKSYNKYDKATEIATQSDKSTLTSEINEQPIESASRKILDNKGQLLKVRTTVSEPNGIETQGKSIENVTQSSTVNLDSSGLKTQSNQNSTQSNSFQTIQKQTTPSPEIQEQPIMRSTVSNLKKQSYKHIEVEGRSPDDLKQSVKSDIVSESNQNKSTNSFKEQNSTPNTPKQTKGIHHNPEEIGQAIKNQQASENLNASENTTVKEHRLAIDTTNQEHSVHRQSANQSAIETSVEKILDSRELKSTGDTKVFQPQIIKGPRADQRSEPLTSHMNPPEIDKGNITELVNKTLHLFKSNESDVKIQLRPKEFGRMQMHINQNENSINLEIITENLLAKNMIEGYLPELKAALLEHGLNLTNHTIITGNPKYEQRKENKNNDRHDKDRKKYPKNAKKSRVSKTNKTGSFTI